MEAEDWKWQLENLLWALYGEILLGIVSAIYLVVRSLFWCCQLNLFAGLSNAYEAIAVAILLCTGCYGLYAIWRACPGPARTTMFLWTIVLNIIVLTMFSTLVWWTISWVMCMFFRGEASSVDATIWMHVIIPLALGTLNMGIAGGAARITVDCYSAAVEEQVILTETNRLRAATAELKRVTETAREVTEKILQRQILPSSPPAYDDIKAVEM
ncbi:uncharacterized protein LOC129600413 [Paramacrobiotus metropolitanus]|uniref:uncharacterized protein LOC129600413 n=1 Tax=Paramacrobiotus metropolitanus TaxID=2943436 RepID=UPI00244644DD|nr:uncharacterized protein LOC129600413 [Paramacrobiotus metropolitanus]